jgi:hypothetical protein
MKNIEKADRFHLGGLIDEIKKGNFVIPDFQREFEWRPWDVRDLIKSIFMDYYVGTLLLWRGNKDNYKLLNCKSIEGFKEKVNPGHIVLDGQQRLTAMYFAFFNPNHAFPRRKSPIIFTANIERLLEEDFDNAFEYNFLTKKNKALFEDKNLQYEQHIFPLGEMKEGAWGVGDWIKGYRDYWLEKAENATGETKTQYIQHSENAKKFKLTIEDLFNNYYISYIELDQAIDVSKVCEIFTQINSKGVRLDIFDLLNAILRPKEIYLKQMWKDTKSRLTFMDNKKMKIYVLQVMSILEQAYCSSKYLYYLVPEVTKSVKTADGSIEEIVLVPDSEAFISKWNNSVDAVEKSINALRNPRDFGAIKSDYVPYPSIIPAFAAIKSYLENSKLKSQIDAHSKIRKWYWSSIFTNRYSSSVESTSARDFQDMRKWFEDNSSQPSMVDEFIEMYKSLDFITENQNGSAIYNAIFNLFVINEARDWSTFELPEYDKLDDHHIVPISAFKKIAGSSINSILNRTPLSSKTNRHIIGSRMPNVYLKEMFDNNDEKKVYSILESHLLSKKAVGILLRDPFTKSDWDEFLEERKSSILQAIEGKLIKESVPTPPLLNEINSRIENVEKKIRALILALASNNNVEMENLIPSHIIQKLNERLNGERRRNPSLNLSVEVRLSFLDLQELFGIIASKATWNSFEDTFKSKETLQLRFNQMAALRNSIRHTRDVVKLRDSKGRQRSNGLKEY